MTEIVRSITHWTGGGGRANETDKKHYHRITEVDGNIVDGNEEIADNIVTSDGDYAAHTLNLNTGSGGFAMAGMKDAVESPFDAGPSPITQKQFEAHCKMLADFHSANGIPVTPKTCLTHAEVESNLGVRQRNKWDLTRLPFRDDLRGAMAVGDYMRERVRSYMPAYADELMADRPLLKKGMRGRSVKELQDLMSDLGFFSGKTDGIFGPRTKAAVMAFQDHANLAPDGIVGRATWSALMTADDLPERDVDEEDLRDGGSRTIAAADQAERQQKAASAGVVTLSTLDVGVDALEKVQGAEPVLSKVQAMLFDNWLILIVIAVGLIWYFKGPEIMARIRAIRVDDARTGANLNR